MTIWWRVPSMKYNDQACARKREIDCFTMPPPIDHMCRSTACVQSFAVATPFMQFVLFHVVLHVYSAWNTRQQTKRRSTMEEEMKPKTARGHGRLQSCTKASQYRKLVFADDAASTWRKRELLYLPVLTISYVRRHNFGCDMRYDKDSTKNSSKNHWSCTHTQQHFALFFLVERIWGSAEASADFSSILHLLNDA